jgi:hypothetical protein
MLSIEYHAQNTGGAPTGRGRNFERDGRGYLQYIHVVQSWRLRQSRRARQCGCRRMAQRGSDLPRARAH